VEAIYWERLKWECNTPAGEATRKFYRTLRWTGPDRPDWEQQQSIAVSTDQPSHLGFSAEQPFQPSPTADDEISWQKQWGQFSAVPLPNPTRALLDRSWQEGVPPSAVDSGPKPMDDDVPMEVKTEEKTYGSDYVMPESSDPTSYDSYRRDPFASAGITVFNRSECGDRGSLRARDDSMLAKR
jgi:hypothetical protein